MGHQFITFAFFLFLLPFNCQTWMQVLLLGAEIKKRFCIDHLMNDDDQNKDAGSNKKNKEVS